MLLEIRYFFLTAQFEVTNGGDDFHIGNNRVEDHVKPDLVVTCAGTAVRNIFSTYFLCVICNRCCLAYAFRAD